MADPIDCTPKSDLSRVGDVAAAICALAWTHGVTAVAEPVNVFASATARLCDTEVVFDHVERLLLGLVRGGFVTDEQRFALHAAYLQQQLGGVQPIR